MTRARLAWRSEVRVAHLDEVPEAHGFWTVARLADECRRPVPPMNGIITDTVADDGSRIPHAVALAIMDIMDGDVRESIDMVSQPMRDRIMDALRDLQPNCSVEDAIERLVLLAKIEEGLAQLDRGEGIPHDEVKRRLEL